MNNGGDQYFEQDVQYLILEFGEVCQWSKLVEKGQCKGEINLDFGVGDMF